MRATVLTLALLLGGTATLAAQTRPDPGVSPVSGPTGPPANVASMAARPVAGCLETRDGSPSVPAFDFEGRQFEASGSPEPVHADNLDSMGALGELTVYAGRLAARPVVDLWVPVCRPAGHYQLYTRAG